MRKFGPITLGWPSWGRKSGGSEDYISAYLRLLAGAGRQSKAGTVVTIDSALRCSAYLACVRVIAQGIAQVPWQIYRKSSGRREVQSDHPLYYLLHTQANPWQTSYEFRETLGVHLTMCGKAYVWRTQVRGQDVELIPLPPNRVEAKRLAGGEMTYVYTSDDGQRLPLTQDDVWHIRGMGFDGVNGLDGLDLAREVLGLAIATEEEHAARFRNGIQPSGTYSLDGTLTGKQLTDLQQAIKLQVSGANAGLPLILDRNAKWMSLAMSGVDAQHLETRRFQVEEVCRSVGVLPIMVGHADKTQTYASAEQQFQAHVTHTLLPRYVRIEQSADAYLLGRRQVEQGYYTKFNASALVRGTLKDRGEYYAKALGSGGSPAWMTQDEIRELEELNPFGGPAGQLPVATNVPAAPGNTAP
ncbi:MAG TPA: phage portal protein [Burkholderiaceae bacterium]|nr:phage portal protein [Burkholderiaceae bacterium]HNG82599.1 phage portal protein [Burkholderiaceae bacterium]